MRFEVLGSGWMYKPGVQKRGLGPREVILESRSRLELRTWGKFAIKGLKYKLTL